MSNIYATCISYHQRGILLTGQSGSGKSDLALQMIQGQGATLVADDRTDLTVKQGKLVASCPQKIQGLLEVRGVGIIQIPYTPRADVDLYVELVDSWQKIDRMPKVEMIELEGIKIRKIKIYPFENSAIYKIMAACDENTLAC